LEDSCTTRRMIFLILTSSILVARWGIGMPGKPTPTPTPTPMEIAKTVLERVADIVCPDNPNSSVSATDTECHFWCMPAGGHYTAATLQWFGNQNDAGAAFESQREGRQVLEFHDFPLLVWGEDHPSFPGGQQESKVWLWQAHQWLVVVHSFDDTHFTVAPDPGTVSRILYQVGVEYGLFPAE